MKSIKPSQSKFLNTLGNYYLIMACLLICSMVFPSCKKTETASIIYNHVFEAEDSLVVSRFEKLDSIVFTCMDSSHIFKGPIRAKRILLEYNQPQINIQGDPDFTGAKPYSSSSAKIVYYDSVLDVSLWIQVSIFTERSGARLSSVCKYYLKYGALGNYPYSAIPLYSYYYNYKGAFAPKNTKGLPHGFAGNYMSELNVENSYIGQRTFKNCFADSQYLRFPEKTIAVLDSNAFPTFSYQRETMFMHPDGRYETISNFLYERVR